MKNEMDQPENSMEMIQISRAEYESLKSVLETKDACIAELEQQVQWLMEQIRLRNRKDFGSTSEKASDETLQQMSFLFNEAEVVMQEEEQEKTCIKSHERRKRSGSVRDIIPEDISVEEVVHELSEDERKCPKCGEEMSPIGKEVHETLKIIPARAVLKRDVYITYACGNCEKNDISTPVVKTPKEPAVISGSFASSEAVAYIATQKFDMCSPLYRQENYWKHNGLLLSRQTMANWLIRCSKDWFEPIYDVLHKQLIKHDVLHADETELQVLHESGRDAKTKSYMWLYRTSGDAKQAIVLYDYKPGRSGEFAKSFLEGFSGYLQTDGYSGYNAAANVTHIGCFAHLRRKFDEAIKALPAGVRSPVAEQGVCFCSKLFDLEQEYDDMGLSYEERRKQRLERSKPVMDEMFAWAQTINPAPKSKLGIAFTYLKNQWSRLYNVLLDGRIELSNNRAERSIKPFVMSRKNFLFANTPLGAKSSAVIFSLIQTAKENGLDAYRYLNFVLSQAPKLSLADPSWPEKLTPHYAPDYCKANARITE